MSVIKDAALEERNTRFIPDEIRVALICETRFDFMKDKKLCEEAATNLYNA
jgi:phosphoenolpyruvate carboxylase